MGAEIFSDGSIAFRGMWQVGVSWSVIAGLGDAGKETLNLQVLKLERNLIRKTYILCFSYYLIRLFQGFVE